MGTNPLGVIAGDLDHDGDLDLAVSNTNSNDVSVPLGNGAGSGLGQFNNPRAVAANASDTVIFVADTGNNRIQLYDAGRWSIFLAAGSSVGAVMMPEGVTVLASGNVIIGDTGNNRVQKRLLTGGSAAVIGTVGSTAGKFNRLAGVR